ncbi:MAG: class I SAM-dependent methyltransferase [Chthoniobacterales bacterium]
MDADTARFYSRDGLLSQIYDQLTAAEWEASQNDVPFFLEEARLSGGPLLELGCGTGRLLIPLLSTGVQVSGLDASAVMLEAAKRKRDQLPADIAGRLHLHQGNMSEFELGQQFALILVAFRSFQLLLTPEAQRSCLICIGRHLVPKGRAIINLFDPRYDLITAGTQKSVSSPKDLIHPLSGNHILVETLERENDPLTQTFKERWRFTETDSRGALVLQEEAQLQMRWTFRYEMRHLVESCGFVVESEYSDFRRSAPQYGKEQIWVLRHGTEH